MPTPQPLEAAFCSDCHHLQIEVEFLSGSAPKDPDDPVEPARATRVCTRCQECHDVGDPKRAENLPYIQ
jgi:hypothetical protein